MSEEEANAIDEECKVENVRLQRLGFRRHHAPLPSMRLQGPLRPIIMGGRESSHHPLGVGHNYI